MSKQESVERFKLLAQLCESEEEFIFTTDNATFPEVRTHFKDGVVIGITTIPSSWGIKLITTIERINEAFGRIVDSSTIITWVENGVCMNDGTKDIMLVQNFINSVMDSYSKAPDQTPNEDSSKPTPQDIEILKQVSSKYRFIYRSQYGNIAVVTSNGHRDYLTPLNHYFKFIKYEDGKKSIAQIVKTT